MDPDADACTDLLIACLGDLEEKRASKRISGAQGLLQIAQTTVLVDFLAHRSEGLLDILGDMLRRRGRERELGASLLQCLAVQLENSESAFEETRDLLMSGCSDDTDEETARSACAGAVGLWTFMAGDHEIDSMDTMESLEALLYEDEVGARLAGSAVEAWSLLITTLPPRAAASKFVGFRNRLVELAGWRESGLYGACTAALAVAIETAELPPESMAGDLAHVLQCGMGRREKELSASGASLRRLLQVRLRNQSMTSLHLCTIFYFDFFVSNCESSCLFHSCAERGS
eukprot:m.12151 g.12151  ORF g.12151 m.12151 type:complete len:288 (-) comp2703_c0_seq1:592-1455(-)